MEIKKPKECSWISNESWGNLKMKEKDFVIFVHARKFTKKKIMRKLYFENETSYWRMQTKVRDKLANDIAKCNESMKKGVK